MSKEITLTDGDLRERSEALHKAQELYEELAFLKNPKMPCPECGGAGSTYGGSLGDVCPRCMGARMLDRPGGEDLEMPDFRKLRAAITAYGDALADKALPEGHQAKKHLALPPAESVPTPEEIEELASHAKEQARQLEGPDMSKLPAPAQRPAAGLGGVSDAELDEMEDAMEEAEDE